MATEMKRMMVSIPQDLLSQLETLKKEKFYNTTWSEMFRSLLQQGTIELLNERDRVLSEKIHSPTTTSAPG